MQYNDVKCTKSTCEKYTLKFNRGWDYAVFTIDDTGILQCHSTFGDYAYHWTAFGDNFKEFLCEINSCYLLDKVARRTYFDLDKYHKKAKNELFKLRRSYEINKEDARELYDFINNELSDYNSYDLVCREIYENDILSKMYSGEVFYSEFAPEQDYTPNATAFAYDIFPKFVEILKEEIKKSK